MKKNKRNSNTKKNLSRRERFQLWLDSHKFLGFFLVLGLILAIGLGIDLIFKSLPIPSPITFFLVATLIILISKYIKKKRS